MSLDGPPASGQSQIQSPSLVGHILDGRYRIIRKIGEGGMGEVYAAEHVHIEKRFAIKLLRQEIVTNPEAVTRFRQEARSSSSIGHRNIIAIEDFGQLTDGRIYMCMELLNGAPLNDMITQPMGVDRLLNILIQTGHGLAAAHAKGIVHRDMKPENIFVTIGPNGEDIPKLLDFGIAKVAGNDGVQNNLTRTGTIFGTPFYMAPEQALGNPVDARTDVYAMGVIMYECFAGSLPFQGDSFMGILTQHITVEPEPIAQRAARAGRQLPPGLADVITCCMQKNPAQRFATMDDLVGHLVHIYRSIVGPGMSSYMEAFPVLPSASHQVQRTPPPSTGPVTGAAMIGSGAHAAPVLVHHPSGPAQVLSSASSGVYAAPRPRTNLALIVAILVVVLGGGAVAAILLLGGKTTTAGPGSGSQIAGHGGSSQGGSSQGGSGEGTGQGGVLVRQGSGGDAGSGPDAGSDARAGSGSGVIAHQGSGDPGHRDGSSAGSQHGNLPPPTSVIQVQLSARNAARFEVYDENDAKVLDGPGPLPVPLGESRMVVIKARGFKDKRIEVLGVRKPFKFSLERLSSRPGPGPGPEVGSGTGSSQIYVPPPPPPPQMDCSKTLIDATIRACREQFCKTHRDHDKCLE